MVASSISRNRLAGTDGGLLHVGGGSPLAIDANITLCTRSDGDADRFYDGRLTQLSVYDGALDGTTIAMLLSTVHACSLSSCVVHKSAETTPGMKASFAYGIGREYDRDQ